MAGVKGVLLATTPSNNNRNRTELSVLTSCTSCGTDLALLEGSAFIQFEVVLLGCELSWVENSSTASTPDGSSPGAMSWPGHFLSGGLVLIKAWASGNAPYSPSSSSFFFFLQPLSSYTPSSSREAKKYTFSLLPHFPPLVSVPLSPIPYPCFV